MKKTFMLFLSLMLVLGMIGCTKEPQPEPEDHKDLLKLMAENSWFYDGHQNLSVSFSADPETYTEAIPNSGYSAGGSITSVKHIKDNEYEFTVHYPAQEATAEHEATEAFDAKMIITYDKNNPGELLMKANPDTDKEQSYHFFTEKGLSQEALIRKLAENGPFAAADGKGFISFNPELMVMVDSNSTNFYETKSQVLEIKETEYLGYNYYRVKLKKGKETPMIYLTYDPQSPDYYYQDVAAVGMAYYKDVPMSIEELFDLLEPTGTYTGGVQHLCVQFIRKTLAMNLWLEGTSYFETGACSNLVYNGSGTYKLDFVSTSDGLTYEVMIHIYNSGLYFYMEMPDAVHNNFDYMYGGKG